MKLRLPRYDQLDPEEQDPIYHAPLNQSMLVTGPPGTGKTVLAVYRLQRYAQKNTSRGQCKMLVYNRTLHQYISNGLKTLKIEASADTWHSWFYRFYREMTGETPPSQDFKYDWLTIIPVLAQHIGNLSKKTYIVDEGQDMPPEFYLFIKLISTHLMVFADQNQRITAQNTTLLNIKQNAGFNDGECHIVNHNYRNTRQVAEVAARFFMGRPEERPALPNPDNKGPAPKYLVLGDEQQYSHILNYCVNNPRREIGILVPSAKEVRRVYRKLFAEAKIRDRVEMYFDGLTSVTCPEAGCGHLMFESKANGGSLICTWNANHTLDLEGRPRKPVICEKEHAISILCYPSAKGVEFDTVFLPFLEPDRGATDNNDKNKMLFYVLAARPRTELLFLSEHSMNRIPIIHHNVSDLLAPVQSKGGI